MTTSVEHVSAAGVKRRWFHSFSSSVGAGGQLTIMPSPVGLELLIIHAVPWVPLLFLLIPFIMPPSDHAHSSLDRAPIHLVVLRCSGRKQVMKESETSCWKEVLGRSDALNHSCLDPCCPEELSQAGSPGPCGGGFQEPEFQKECGRLDAWGRKRQEPERDEPSLRGRALQ